MRNTLPMLFVATVFLGSIPTTVYADAPAGREELRKAFQAGNYKDAYDGLRRWRLTHATTRARSAKIFRWPSRRSRSGSDAMWLRRSTRCERLAPMRGGGCCLTAKHRLARRESSNFAEALKRVGNLLQHAAAPAMNSRSCRASASRPGEQSMSHCLLWSIVGAKRTPLRAHWINSSPHWLRSEVEQSFFFSSIGGRIEAGIRAFHWYQDWHGAARVSLAHWAPPDSLRCRPFEIAPA